MRTISYLVVGVATVWMSCSSSSPTDLFSPIRATGSGPSPTTTGSDPNNGTGSGGSASAGRAGTTGIGGAVVNAGGTYGGDGSGGQASTGASGSAGVGNGGSNSGGTGGIGGATGGSDGTAGRAGVGGLGGAVGGSVGTAGRGGSPGGSAGLSIDGGVEARADGGTLHRIQCGNTSCSAPGQFCCIPDGGSAHCVAAGGTCAANGNKIHCDDRTDCEGEALICCAADIANGSSVADCRLLSACTGRTAQVLCDPRETTSCVGSGKNGSCSSNGPATIGGYPFCH